MLKEQLMKDLKQAMINKDELQKNTIIMLKAAIQQIEKDKNITLSENEILDIISKQIKQRVDVIPSYEKLNRLASIECLNREIDILKSYLPKQLTREEIIELVNEAKTDINANTIKDLGVMMMYLRPRILGKADGKIVSEIVKDILNKEV